MSGWTPESGLRVAYPGLPWDEPLIVRVSDVTVHVCRYCVALHGLKGIEVLNGDAGYGSEQECQRHIEEQHS